MKKRIMMLAVIFGMSAMLLMGCGEKTDSAAETEAAAGETAEADTADGAAEEKDYGPMVHELNLADYVTLGEYKGLTAAFDKYEPTDEDIEAAIESSLERAATDKEVTGRPVAEGDIVNIDYEGKKDGVAFDGGTAQGYDLTIGSHSFIEGFEDGLIGAEVGQTLDLDLTFPENYHSEELAGQAVVFTVRVNAIKEKVTPELTDEIVPTLDADCKTVEEYRNTVRENIIKNAENTAKQNTKDELLKQAVANAEIKSVPEGLIEEKTDTAQASALNYANSYGVSLEDFVSQAMGVTMEEFEEQSKQYAEEDARSALVIAAIAEAEGLTISDEEAKAQIEPYVEAMGGKDYDSLMKSYIGRGYREYLQMEKVTDWLYDNAELVAASADGTSEKSGADENAEAK